METSETNITAEERAAIAVDGIPQPVTSPPVVEEKIAQASVEVAKVPAALGPALAAIKADDQGRLVGSTFEDQFRLAKAYFGSGLMPKALNSVEKVLVAVQLCRELGLPPMASLGKICVINGTPSIFGDLPLALVMKSGLLIDIKEYLIGEDGQEVSSTEESFTGAVCIVVRKGKSAVLRQFTIADAKKAKIWEKSSSPWLTYPKRMLQMRARTWALKDAFPDVLLGITIGEYDLNTVAEMVDDSGSRDLAKEINEEYGVSGVRKDSGRPVPREVQGSGRGDGAGEHHPAVS